MSDPNILQGPGSSLPGPILRMQQEAEELAIAAERYRLMLVTVILMNPDFKLRKKGRHEVYLPLTEVEKALHHETTLLVGGHDHDEKRPKGAPKTGAFYCMRIRKGKPEEAKPESPLHLPQPKKVLKGVARKDAHGE